MLKEDWNVSKYEPFKFQRMIVVSLEQDMINLPLEATAMLMISAECLTGKSNSPVTEAPEPSFFLFTLNTRIVFPFAKAVINALQGKKYIRENQYHHNNCPSPGMRKNTCTP